MSNKYQEALNNLRKFEREHNMLKFGDVVPQSNSDTLQELVDKETSMTPPLKWEYAKPQTRCRCSAGVEKYHNYCWNCGQKLDWSDDNE